MVLSGREILPAWHQVTPFIVSWHSEMEAGDQATSLVFRMNFIQTCHVTCDQLTCTLREKPLPQSGSYPQD